MPRQREANEAVPAAVGLSSGVSSAAQSMVDSDAQANLWNRRHGDRAPGGIVGFVQKIEQSCSSLDQVARSAEIRVSADSAKADVKLVGPGSLRVHTKRLGGCVVALKLPG